MMKHIALAALAVFLATPAEAKVKVVTSFSILADITSNIGGDAIELTTLVPAGADAHTYEPKPDDLKAIATADVVIVNGLGFEGWQTRLFEAANFKKRVVTATDGVKVRYSEAKERSEVEAHSETETNSAEHEHDHGHSDLDPHAWQNAANIGQYVKNITVGLCAADSTNCKNFEARAKSYSDQIAVLDGEIKEILGATKPEDRVVITSHEAFGYFADAYEMTFLAPEGMSTEAEASAKDVAKVISQIRERKAKALFLENISDPRLLEQIASETGLQSGGTLYSDALAQAPDAASTYIGMMRHNAKAIASAMSGH
jgi:zinc/manganese transport system substrate-binding protein